jgi:hypothetical protein
MHQHRCCRATFDKLNDLYFMVSPDGSHLRIFSFAHLHMDFTLSEFRFKELTSFVSFNVAIKAVSKKLIHLLLQSQAEMWCCHISASYNTLANDNFGADGDRANQKHREYLKRNAVV